MKKLLILPIALLILAGCESYDSSFISRQNDQNIIEFKKCTEAGMVSRMNPYGDVLCRPE